MKHRNQTYKNIKIGRRKHLIFKTKRLTHFWIRPLWGHSKGCPPPAEADVALRPLMEPSKMPGIQWEDRNVWVSWAYVPWIGKNQQGWKMHTILVEENCVRKLLSQKKAKQSTIGLSRTNVICIPKLLHEREGARRMERWGSCWT